MMAKKRILGLLLISGLWYCYGYDHYAPQIVEEPADMMVARHQPATLQCRAEGTPAPTVRWYKDGVALVSGGRRVILPAGGLFFLRTAYARRDSDAGVYWCEATNAYGTVRSKNATLQVAVLREDFRLEPADTRAAAGDTALLECTPPRGTPDPLVSWKKNGQLLDLEENTRLSIVDGGNLVIQDLRQIDDGRYQCLAKNMVGVRESTVAHLRVLVKPYLIVGPEDATALTGSSVTFRCRVGGDPLPDVLWRRSAGGGNMPLGRVHILEDRSLRLDSIILEDDGEYSCEADNSVGAITASGILKVHSPPHLDIRPMAQSVEVGMDAFFECSASGSPKPTVFWSVEGNRSLIFPGVSWHRYDASLEILGKSKLILRKAEKDDSGSTVMCSAINSAGAVTGRAKLMVTSEEDRPPPVIIQGPSNQTLPIKSIAEFLCTASGYPEPNVTWYHKSSPIITSSKVNVSENGSLIVKNLAKEDSGVYTCVASSKNGRYEWSATLRVDVPTNPSINFFRAPDPSTLPGEPGRPIVKNLTESSVTISWSQSNKIGSSSLLGYRVEMFGASQESWVTVAQRVQHSTYTQNRLRPAAQYIFMVRAENSHGFSPPSEFSETTIVGSEGVDASTYNDDGAGTALLAEARASLQTDEVVQILEVTPVESTIVKLAWETMNSFSVEGFYIYYRPLDSPNCTAGDYNMQSVLHSGSASGFSISNLSKYTTYEFFLIPFYKNIDGRPSNSKTARTLEDVPTEPPIQVEAFLLNSSFVYLKWRPPPAAGRNGDIKYYRVVIKEAGNESRPLHNVTVAGAGVALGGLRPAAAYSLQLAAATARGEGPYTPAAALRLPLDLDPASKLLNHPRNPHRQNPQQMEPTDLLTETWFLALLGSTIVVMTLLFIVTYLIRRHQILSKKSALPNLYDSRSTGASLVAHLNLKSAAPSALTSTYNHSSISKADSLSWMDNRPGSWRRSAKEASGADFARAHEPGALPEYDKINSQTAPDYAEVDAAMICYRKPSPDSPSAYASVTVVDKHQHQHQHQRPHRHQHSGSRGWIHMCTGSKTKAGEENEEVYPANNGGYYNRNVYSDTYFADDRPNIFQFSDICQVGNAESQIEVNAGSEFYSGNNLPKERTYSLPQTPCTTIRRSHRLQIIRAQNADKHTSKSESADDRANADSTPGLKEMRTQENPTFGLVDSSNIRNFREDTGQDKNSYSIQPMKLIDHQYSKASPNRPNNKTNVMYSFSTMKFPATHAKVDYQTTSRSECGNQ